MIEACKFINDNNIIKLRLSRVAYVDKSNIYGVLKRYLSNKEHYFTYNRTIEYKGFKVNIKSNIAISYRKNIDWYQCVNITPDSSDFIEESNTILLSDDDKFITLTLPTSIIINPDNNKVDLDKTVKNICEKYKEKYFITNEDYIDITLAVEFKNIKNEIVNIIDTISDIENPGIKIYNVK